MKFEFVLIVVIERVLYYKLRKIILFKCHNKRKS